MGRGRPVPLVPEPGSCTHSLGGGGTDRHTQAHAETRAQPQQGQSRHTQARGDPTLLAQPPTCGDSYRSRGTRPRPRSPRPAGSDRHHALHSREQPGAPPAGTGRPTDVQTHMALTHARPASLTPAAPGRASRVQSSCRDEPALPQTHMTDLGSGPGNLARAGSRPYTPIPAPSPGR